jgi:hypothetical protein
VHVNHPNSSDGIFDAAYGDICATVVQGQGVSWSFNNMWGSWYSVIECADGVQRSIGQGWQIGNDYRGQLSPPAVGRNGIAVQAVIGGMAAVALPIIDSTGAYRGWRLSY